MTRASRASCSWLKVVDGGLALVFGIGELAAKRARGEPRLGEPEEIVGVCGVLGRLRSGAFSSVVGSFVFVQKALKRSFRISACADQVFFSIVEFVLIEFRSALASIICALAASFASPVAPSACLDRSARRSCVLLSLASASSIRWWNSRVSGARLPGNFGSVAKGVREREVYFVVREPQDILSQLMFFGGGGERRDFPCRLQRRSDRPSAAVFEHVF